MKKIDSLLKRAQQLAPMLFPTISTITETGGRFLLGCALWDGEKAGKVKNIEAEYETAEEARTAYDNFLKQYPRSKRWEPVLLDMVMVMEGGDIDEETASAPINAEGSESGADENGE